MGIMSDKIAYYFDKKLSNRWSVGLGDINLIKLSR